MPVSLSTGGQASGASRPHVEAYDEWRERFAAERLRVLYFLGLAANPAFIVSDYLLYRDQLSALLVTRGFLELGYLICGLFLLPRFRVLKPNVLVVLFVWIGNAGISHLTVTLGGFTSQYYNGLNLVFLAASVIVPIWWRSHLVAQVGSILYYYLLNFFLSPAPTVDVHAAIGNAFFLSWTCIALLFSVFLYERLQRTEFATRRELEASHAKLLELDRLKSEFFANISHELRTPLTLSLGAYKGLLSMAPSAEAGDLIHTGLRNTGRLLFLINELLDLAKFDSGRGQVKKACVDLAQLVRSVAANFQSSGERRVHLRGVSDPVPAEVDPRQMQKVLFNLLSNSFKFSDPAEGQVWIRLSPKGDAIELEVEDNGIGIPRDQLDRIFDRFTQVEGSATRRYEGSGIGLSLVKEIVMLHGGTITVESQVGQGSTFLLTLPRGQARSEDLVSLDEDLDAFVKPGLPDQSESASGEGEAGADRPLVVVAEDNADMRAYLERVLRPHFRIALARDGVEGLDRAKALAPDLIVTDSMMPRMSGADLLKAVRSDEALRMIPVIFLTARAGAEARVESLEAGADDYIAKPFDEPELLARVNNLIRARAQERELAALQQEKLGRFLPSHLTEALLSGKGDDRLKSHRSEVTVLFIDLRGFTALTETADPEDLMAVLREYQTEMGHLIDIYQGTLERFSGDDLMVFFNDPVPMPNHAEQAIRMAVAMRDRFADLRLGWSKRGFELGAGLGLATGYATVGVIGFEGRLDYAAIGTVTNLAARLCSQARDGQILVSGRVLALIEPLVHTESLGALTLKGFHRPVDAYNVTGLKE